MKVLLCYPQFPADTFWSFDRALALSERKATMPPLGLLTVAGMMSTDDFDVDLADENLAAITDEKLASADVIFASAMLAQRESLERLIERCNRIAVPIVVGGPLITGCYRDLAEDGLRPTTWFIGEAEKLLPPLLEDLLKGQLGTIYAHVVSVEDAEEVRNALGEPDQLLVGDRPSLDSSPLPRFDLLDHASYHSMAIQASRGCPIGCEFCDIWVQFGLKSRIGSPTRITDQLDYLFTLGWRGRVFIVDDNFIGNVGAARGLLPALEAWQKGERSFRWPLRYLSNKTARQRRSMVNRWRRDRQVKYPFAFSTEADVRIGSDAPKMIGIREAMARAGFNGVFLGIETPSADALKEAGKRVNVGGKADTAQHLLDSVRRIQETGIQVMSGFIVGFDHDPEHIDRDMVEFIEAAGIPMAMVGLLSVVPGTELQKRLIAEGRYRGRLHGDQTHSFKLDFVPRGRSEATIVMQYARVLEKLYGGRMESYYLRCERMMSALPTPPRTGDRAGLRELRTFVRSLVKIRPRRSYWAILGRTLLRQPKYLGLAVVLALQGEHLHKLTVSSLRKFRSRSSVRPARSSHSTRIGLNDSQSGLSW